MGPVIRLKTTSSNGDREVGIGEIDLALAVLLAESQEIPCFRFKMLCEQSRRSTCTLVT